MSLQVQPSLASLYEEDETAWLELTARLVTQGRFEEIDCSNLSEYLCDMARRDRREVYSRLRVLLAHLLKWEQQPEQRTNSWRGTIFEQRDELQQLLESGTLLRHAVEILPEVYAKAVKQAAEETGLPKTTFPPELGRTLDDVLAGELAS